MTMTDRLAGINEGVAVKAPCKVATTANISALSGLLTVDGVTLTAGDRVLVKDQSTASQNGIYVAAAGVWERAPDFDGSRDVVEGTTVFVISGSTNASTFFRLATTSPDVGTDNLTFTQLFDSSSWTFTQSGTGAVTRTAQSKMRDVVNVFDFMTTAQIADVQAGSASLDVSSAIQNAINSLGTNGGTVYFPGGWYRIDSGINIGDGNYGSTPSTKNGIKLVGSGGGFGVSGALVPTVITWGGAAGTTYMFTVKGRISDVEISGMFLRCLENCNGIYAKAFSGSRFHHLKISNPRAYGFAVIGGDPPIENYNISNQWDTITIDLSRASSVGFYFDGYYDNLTPYLIDTWASSVHLCQVNVSSGATNAVCCWLKFCDSMLWTKCYFDAAPEGTAVALVLDALTNNGYPVGHCFVSCHITSITVSEDGSNFIRKNTFIAHGSYDGEVFPSHAKLVGFTEQGVILNDFFTSLEPSAAVKATAWTSASATVSSSAGTITSASGTVRHYTFGKFAYFHLTVTVTTNGTGSGILQAALPQNAKSIATFSGWNTTDSIPVFGYMTAAANTLNLKKVDGSYPGADGKTIVISGSYEVA